APMLPTSEVTASEPHTTVQNRFTLQRDWIVALPREQIVSVGAQIAKPEGPEMPPAPATSVAVLAITGTVAAGSVSSAPPAASPTLPPSVPTQLPTRRLVVVLTRRLPPAPTER